MKVTPPRRCYTTLDCAFDLESHNANTTSYSMGKLQIGCRSEQFIHIVLRFSPRVPNCPNGEDRAGSTERYDTMARYANRQKSRTGTRPSTRPKVCSRLKGISRPQHLRGALHGGYGSSYSSRVSASTKVATLPGVPQSLISQFQVWRSFPSVSQHFL